MISGTGDWVSQAEDLATLYAPTCYMIICRIWTIYMTFNTAGLVIKYAHRVVLLPFVLCYIVPQWIPHTITSVNMHRTLTHWGRDTKTDISQTAFSNAIFDEIVGISINISLKCIFKGQINNIPTMVQIMVLRRPRDKPLSEPLMLSFLPHICVTRTQWINSK